MFDGNTVKPFIKNLATKWVFHPIRLEANKSLTFALYEKTSDKPGRL
jgi:hypothetical protein